MPMDRERPRGRKRRKVCSFCVDKVEHIDYKDAAKLRRFLSERSKILPRRTTGTCAMHQRQLTQAIKRTKDIRYWDSPTPNTPPEGICLRGRVRFLSCPVPPGLQPSSRRQSITAASARVAVRAPA